MFKCQIGHSGHSLGHTSGPSQHPTCLGLPCPSLSSPPPPPPPVSPGWEAGPLTACPAFQILVQVKEVLSKLSTLVETTLKEVRVAGGGGVGGPGAGLPGWGGAVELRNSQTHLAWSAFPLSLTPCLSPPMSLFSWPLGFCPTLFVSVSPACVFAWFLSLIHI